MRLEIGDSHLTARKESGGSSKEPDGDQQAAGELNDTGNDAFRIIEFTLTSQNAEQFLRAVTGKQQASEGLRGALQVTLADPARIWDENEIMMLRTVADQVAVAVNHAALIAQIQQQALTDALTGCHNRRSFEMQLEQHLLMVKRLHQPLSLIMLDVDRFKHLNDSAGHDAGDIALRELGNCFRQVLRGADSAARFGGDEFVLILPLAPAEGALIVAERLRARIQQIEIPGFGGLTASIGIASFPAHAETRMELFQAADAALYAAKHAGRNCVRVASESAQDLDVNTAVAPNHDMLPEAGEAVM